MNTVNNNDLVQDAGKVKLDQAQPWGKGILGDFKRTVGTHWLSEVTNFNQKTIAVSLLLFISVIAPTLTFGAVYGKVTDNNIGAIETIMATSWVGIAYSLVGGMPLCVIGSTGPVLALSTSLYSISKNLDIPFLPFYAWVSVWLFIYCFIAAFFDLTRYVQMATRFTDEIFALLIVSIFVMDAIGDPFSNVGILRYFDPNHPSHEEHDGDDEYDYLQTAFLSTILGLGTCSLIFFLRGFRFSPFFCSDGVRTSIHDFSVTVSVVGWTLVKEFLFSSVETEKLQVPDRFEPSFQCCDADCRLSFPDECVGQAESVGTRNWLANLGDLNGKGWVPLMAAGPGVLAFLLNYLDCGITWHLINHKGHKLQHGEAYNYDLLLVGGMNFVNGLLGLPWLVATTVPCIIHLNALADKDKEGNFIKVQETRLTMFLSHLLLGLSILALGALRLLPLPVLYGVFLFMGLSSLPNIQFWNRFLLFFQQPSKYPETPYTKYMEKKRIHMYTIVQICFFFGVFGVMNVKAIAIVFPFMTCCCIPARLFLLPCIFEGWEIVLLDGEDEKIEEWIEAKEGSLNGTHSAAFDMEKGDKSGDSSQDEA